MKNEHQPPPVLEPADPAPEYRELTSVVAQGHGRRLDVRKLQHRPPARAAHGFALVGADAKKPGPYFRPGSQLMERPPCLQRCLLNRVLGRMLIVKHRTRQSITRGDDWPEQRRERLIVACPRSPDQIDVQGTDRDLGRITDHRHEYALTWSPGGRNLPPGD